MKSTKHILILFLSILFLPLLGQDYLPRVYIDCDCDHNYLRQELPYINHVWEQATADVQVFINDLRMGNGGRLYQLNFSGKGPFEGKENRISYETQPTWTADEVRAGLLSNITMGLLEYFLNPRLAHAIGEKVQNSGNEETAQQVAGDPWKSWIFELYGEGEMDRESRRNELDIEVGIQANRITDNWRIRTELEMNHTEKRVDGRDERFVSTRKFYRGRGSAVYSLNSRWSAGIFSELEHSTYRNLEMSLQLQAALEYSLFPYREVIRREITFAYRLGYVDNTYIERTLYGLTNESLLAQSLEVNLRFRQPWGDIATTAEASAFLHDWTKNRIQLDSWVSIRLFKGLSLQFGADLNLIRDQISLPAGNATIEDLLLKQRQIATDFELTTGIGIRYTFGTNVNNVVNTRL